MKEQNTSENKARFFALYYGQKIVRHKTWFDHVENGTNSWQKDFPDKSGFNSYYLYLRSISSLTDEEALIAGKIILWLPEKHTDEQLISLGRGHCDFSKGKDLPMCKSILLADYLRSIGILIPWMDLYQELIDWGWAKV